VAILGVLFLYLDLHGPRFIVREPPTFDNFAAIGPAMNFAQAYLEGKLTFVRYDEETGFLGMFISDNYGNEIFVRAYDSEARRLIRMERQRLAAGKDEPKFPAPGDFVKLRGNLRIRPDFQMMILQFAEGLILEPSGINRPEADQVTVLQMIQNPENFEEHQRLWIGWDENRPVKVMDIENLKMAGAVRPFATKLTLYELGTDAETSLLIPIVFERFGPLPTRIGDQVSVKGAFQLYGGEPQLWLASWDDLEVIS
jgi:hypothetical protein